MTKTCPFGFSVGRSVFLFFFIGWTVSFGMRGFKRTGFEEGKETYICTVKTGEKKRSAYNP